MFFSINAREMNWEYGVNEAWPGYLDRVTLSLINDSPRRLIRKPTDAKDVEQLCSFMLNLYPLRLLLALHLSDDLLSFWLATENTVFFHKYNF